MSKVYVIKNKEGKYVTRYGDTCEGLLNANFIEEEYKPYHNLYEDEYWQEVTLCEGDIEKELRETKDNNNHIISVLEDKLKKQQKDFEYINNINKELGVQNIEYEKQVALLKSSERQFASHIADLTLQIKEKDEEIERQKSVAEFYKSYYTGFHDRLVDELLNLKSELLSNRQNMLQTLDVANLIDKKISKIREVK